MAERDCAVEAANLRTLSIGSTGYTRVDRRSDMSNITGGCHCGAIRYQIEGELIVHALCHCSGLQASRRRADGRLDDVCRGRAQGDEGDSPRSTNHPNMAGGTSAPTAARGCSTSMRMSCPASSIFRARPTTIPMPCRRWCISRPPSGCAGWSARTNCRASSAIRRRHSVRLRLLARKRQFVKGRAAIVLCFYRSRRKEKSSRRARTARDFSHRGDATCTRLTFAFAAPTWMRSHDQKDTHHDEVHSSHCSRASGNGHCNAGVRAGRDTGARRLRVLSSQRRRARAAGRRFARPIQRMRITARAVPARDRLSVAPRHHRTGAISGCLMRGERRRLRRRS